MVEDIFGKVFDSGEDIFELFDVGKDKEVTFMAMFSPLGLCGSRGLTLDSLACNSIASQCFMTFIRCLGWTSYHR